MIDMKREVHVLIIMDLIFTNIIYYIRLCYNYYSKGVGGREKISHAQSIHSFSKYSIMNIYQ